jgi:hypothetical protein
VKLLRDGSETEHDKKKVESVQRPSEKSGEDSRTMRVFNWHGINWHGVRVGGIGFDGHGSSVFDGDYYKRISAIAKGKAVSQIRRTWFRLCWDFGS